MAEKDKRYYWLKLKRDFFKRHDIQIIEGMPNGKDYILFYLKLLCESVDHEGNLRFNEEIPYNEEMLATITRTNIDIVRSAIKIFTQLHMMEIMDDGTYYMSEVNKMLGSETYWAQKKRERREIEALENVQLLSNEIPTCPSKRKSKSKSKRIEKDIEIDTEIDVSAESATPSPATEEEKPPKHKHGEYLHVLLTDGEYKKLISEYGDAMTDKLITFLDEYIEMKGYKAKSHYLAILKWVVNAVNEQDEKDRKRRQQSNPARGGRLDWIDDV